MANLKLHASSWLFGVMCTLLASSSFCLLCPLWLTGHAGIACVYSLVFIYPGALVAALLAVYFVPMIKKNRLTSLIVVSIPTLLFVISGVTFPDGTARVCLQVGSFAFYIGVPAVFVLILILLLGRRHGLQKDCRKIAEENVNSDL